MVPKDNEYTNLRVAKRLVVGEAITTPTINTQDITVHRNIVLTENATITRESGSSEVPQSNVVFTTGDQTIGGVKTFVETPVFSNGGVVLTSSDQTINGVKTFVETPIFPTNGGIVLTSGDQTIGGAKTFTDATTFGTSVLLPTSGGTPTALTFYEELSTTVDFTSGMFAGALTANVQFTRVGNMVTMLLSSATTTANGTPGVLTSTVIPARFRPNVSINATMQISDGGIKLGSVSVSGGAFGGVISIGKATPSGSDIFFGNFTGTNLSVVGTRTGAISWIA